MKAQGIMGDIAALSGHQLSDRGQTRYMYVSIVTLTAHF